EGIGFDHPDKRARLESFAGRAGNTNVDVVPIDPVTLVELRRSLGLSMKRLAALTGCARPTLSRIESGHRRPSRALLLRLLEALENEWQTRPVTDLAQYAEWRRLKSLCGVRWTPIKELTPVEYSHPYVYDLSVPGAETFLAGTGGLIVHNTFTMANIVSAVQRPTLILAHNKTLAAQLYGEMREFFPRNAVEYFVSYYDYYQPEAYVPSSD